MPESDSAMLDWLLDALYAHNATGRITRINEPDGARAPCFAMVRTAAERRWRFRDDTPGEVETQLNGALSLERPQPDLHADPGCLHLLRAAFPGAVAHAGPEHLFSESLAVSSRVTRIERGQCGLLAGMGWNVEALAATFSQGAPYFAVIEEGRVVSVCYSSRLTEHVAEAGVETLEPFRGRGYAAEVAAAWALAVRETGQVPIYGTSWDNHASLAVARNLHLIPFAASFSLG